MTFHHHPSFFPAVIVLITLGLVGFMMYGLKPSPPPSAAPVQSAALSEADYEQAVARISAALDTTKQKVDVATVDQALNQLLQLYVSAQLQERHLNSAQALLKWRDAITAENATLAAEAQAAFYKNNPAVK